MWIIATLATTQNLPQKKKEKKPLILVALNLGLQFSVREEAERTCKGRKLAKVIEPGGKSVT
jgi:hypothetical protein